MTRVYKGAVIGVGGRGSGWAEDLRKHKEIELKAVCDINDKAAKQVAAASFTSRLLCYGLC